MFKNILLATDGHESTEKALQVAIYLSKNLGARLHIISVIDLTMVENISQHLIDVLKTGAENAIEKTIDKIKEQNIEIDIIKHITTGKPSTEIINYTNQNKTDLVVIGTTQKTGFTKFLLGSVAEDMIRKSKIPVLIVPIDRINKN